MRQILEVIAQSARLGSGQLLIATATMVPVLSAELSTTQVIEGANMGRRAITTAKVSYVHNARRHAIRSEEEIQESIALELARTDSAGGLPEHQRDGLRMNLSRLLHPHEEAEERVVTVAVDEDAEDEGERLLSRYRMEMRSLNKLSGPLASHVGKGYKTTRTYDGEDCILVKTSFFESHEVTNAVRSFSCGLVELDRVNTWGRPVDAIPSSAVLIGLEEFDEAQCYHLAYEESTVTQGVNLTRHVWIDPDRGFAVVKREILANGSIRSRTVFQEFSQVSGIWFPKRGVATYFVRDGTLNSLTVDLEVDSVELNYVVEISAFDPPISDEMAIVDLRYGSPLFFLGDRLIGQ